MTISRQKNRHIARQTAKNAASRAKADARIELRRALLRRQTVREKAGFYGSLSVGKVRAPSRSRLSARKVKKSQPYGRIIKEIDGEALHATKGWRKA